MRACTQMHLQIQACVINVPIHRKSPTCCMSTPSFALERSGALVQSSGLCCAAIQLGHLWGVTHFHLKNAESKTPEIDHTTSLMPLPRTNRSTLAKANNSFETSSMDQLGSASTLCGQRIHNGETLPWSSQQARLKTISCQGAPEQALLTVASIVSATALDLEGHKVGRLRNPPHLGQQLGTRFGQFD